VGPHVFLFSYSLLCLAGSQWIGQKLLVDAAFVFTCAPKYFHDFHSATENFIHDYCRLIIVVWYRLEEELTHLVERFLVTSPHTDT
jgi:hypothetical protein